MARSSWRKHKGALYPADEMAEATLARIKDGSLVLAEPKQARNIQHHRLYWQLVTTVWHNIDQRRYSTPEKLHEALKVCLGISSLVVLPDGREVHVPGSISFARMDQTEFSAYYDRVCRLICEHFLPGIDEAELRREVEQMVGIRRETAA